MSGLDNIIEQLALTTVNDEIKVSFAGKGLKLDTEEDAREIVEAIKNSPGMTTLCLEGNTIGVQAAKAIAKALESQSNFRNALWKDMFTRRTEHEIPDALNFLSSGIMLANAHLSELDLSDNAFGFRGLKGIVSLLKSEACFTLKELRLNNNGLGISGAKMLASALSQCLESSTLAGKPLKLELFICGRNRLENEGSLALSSFLKHVKTLKYIAMPQNGIYHEGICGLAKAFAANLELKVLNLEDNSLTEEGAKYIADVLPVLEKLEVINFGDCLLKTGGAISIAKSLRISCPNLIELLLGYNEISEEGGLEIVNAVENKMFLKTLMLNGNQFGPDGCQKIIDGMQSMNKFDVLGSLSEDESSDEDDEKNGNDDEDDLKNGNENEEHKKETTEIKNDENVLQNGITQDIKFSDFIMNPTTEKLTHLNRSEASILPELPEKPTLTDYFYLFYKVSSVVKQDDQIDKAAVHFANELFAEAFKIHKQEEAWKFNNDFLVLLGLIKAEDKKIINEHVNGSLYLLKYVVKNSFFPQSTRDLLKFILSRPLRVGNVSPIIISTLLQILYQQQ